MPTFLVSDETVNRYGYRVLTDGIDISQFERNPVLYYLHDRYQPGQQIAVVGRWENLRKEKGKLYADPVFDEEDPLGKELKRKVDKGFLKMASIQIQTIESSTDTKLLKSGQTRPTVTKSELIEISIVDRGGNNNALRLSDENGNKAEVDAVLPIIQDTNTHNRMADLKSLAQALKLSADASESDLLVRIQELNAVEERLTALEEANKNTLKLEAEALVDKAIEKGVLPKHLKEMQLSAFEKDHGKQKEALEKLMADAKDEQVENNKQLSDVITTVTSKSSEGGEKDTFLSLSQNDPAKLAKIERENPELFKKLLDEYANENEKV